jgi:hypothetical protein
VELLCFCKCFCCCCCVYVYVYVYLLCYDECYVVADNNNSQPHAAASFVYDGGV